MYSNRVQIHWSYCSSGWRHKHNRKSSINRLRHGSTASTTILMSLRKPRISSVAGGLIRRQGMPFWKGKEIFERWSFTTFIYTYRLDNTIYRWKGGQNSCGWSPFYWFSLTDNLFGAGGGIQLCFALSFHLSLFNEFPCVDIDKIGLTEIYCVPLCEKFGTFQTSDNG